MKKIYLHCHKALTDFIHGLSDALFFNGIDNEVREVSPELINEIWLGIWHRVPLLPKRYIAYNSESLRKKSNLAIFHNAIETWDFASENLPLHKHYGISNVKLVPMGYSPYYELKFGNRKSVKDIDVIMYGWQSERRRCLIQKLRDLGLNTVWIGEDGKYVYDDHRDDLIARSKIVVSVCQLDPQLYATNDFSRLSYLIANKIFTISEPIGDPVVEGQWANKIIMRPFDEIAQTCADFVNRDTDRKQIVESAYEYAVSSFNLRSLVPIESLQSILA